MKKLTIIAIAISLASCTGITKQSKDDSVSMAVFSAHPLDYVEDSEPVYIDHKDLLSYGVGDTVEVNDKGFIPAKNSPQSGWHEVVLDYRLPEDQKFSRDEAEQNQ